MFRWCSRKPKDAARNIKFTLRRINSGGLGRNLDFLKEKASSKNSKTSSRLDQAKAILMDELIRFPLSAYRCQKLYKDQDTNLVEEALSEWSFPDDGTLSFILLHYSISNSLRVLLLTDLIELLIKRKREPIVETLLKMRDYGLLPSNLTKRLLELASSTLDNLSVILTELTLSSGESLLASSFVLKLIRAGIQLPNDLIRLLIRSLTVGRTTNNNYNAFVIIKLLDIYGEDIFLLEEMNQILRYLTLSRLIPYFANIFFDRILKSSNLYINDEKEINDFFENCRRLLSKNIEEENLVRSLRMWYLITSRYPSFEKTSLHVLRQLMTSLSESRPELLEDFLIKNTKEDLFKEPELLDFFLRYFGKSFRHLDRFNYLMKSLNPPLLRSTLSLLLEVFVLKNDKAVTDRLLHAIQKTTLKVRPIEFSSIIKGLLLQDKISESVTIVSDIDVNFSKWGYLSIFLHILWQKKGLEEYSEFLNVMAKKFQKLDRNDSCIDFLTLEVFNFVSQSVSNRASKKLYTTIAYSPAKLNEGVEKFNLPKRFNSLLHIKNNRKNRILSSIAKQAILEEDLHTLLWCIDEFRYVGIFVEDIFFDLRCMNPTFMDGATKIDIPTTM